MTYTKKKSSPPLLNQNTIVETMKYGKKAEWVEIETATPETTSIDTSSEFIANEIELFILFKYEWAHPSKWKIDFDIFVVPFLYSRFYSIFLNDKKQEDKHL